MNTTSKLGHVSVHHVNSFRSVEADKHIYCGRNRNIPAEVIHAGLGNPHPIGWCPLCRINHNRTTCIRAYDLDLETNPNHPHHRGIARIALRITEGLHLALYCHCAPEPCHCDIIRQRAEKLASLA